VRVTNNHSCSSATETKKSVAQAHSSNGFAEALSSATASDDDGNTRKPELSAATYRLFAAVATERGDTTHANLFRTRAAAAQEAGIPLHPSGVLSETGRWDYNEKAAKIPETGHFDTATGQGLRTFIPYNARNPAKPEGCEPKTTTVAQADTATKPSALNADTVARISDSDPLRFIKRQRAV
jgi:hypothetical protein